MTATLRLGDRVSHAGITGTVTELDVTALDGCRFVRVLWDARPPSTLAWQDLHPYSDLERVVCRGAR